MEESPMSGQTKEIISNPAECLSMLKTHEKKTNELRTEILQKDWIDRLISKIGIRYQDKNFSDFAIHNGQQKKIKEIAESYVSAFQKNLEQETNLIFMGKSGTGKTLLALIMYQTLIKFGWMAEYNANINFLKRLREKQSTSHSKFESTLTFYKNLPFLILDEVTEGCGANAALADWEQSILRLIIDKRYSSKKSTLIITNRNKDELIERLGEPIVSRLTENGIALAFNWESFRKL